MKPSTIVRLILTLTWCYFLWGTARWEVNVTLYGFMLANELSVRLSDERFAILIQLIEVLKKATAPNLR